MLSRGSCTMLVFGLCLEFGLGTTASACVPVSKSESQIVPESKSSSLGRMNIC